MLVCSAMAEYLSTEPLPIGACPCGLATDRDLQSQQKHIGMNGFSKSLICGAGHGGSLRSLSLGSWTATSKGETTEPNSAIVPQHHRPFDFEDFQHSALSHSPPHTLFAVSTAANQRPLLPASNASKHCVGSVQTVIGRARIGSSQTVICEAPNGNSAGHVSSLLATSTPDTASYNVASRKYQQSIVY